MLLFLKKKTDSGAKDDGLELVPFDEFIPYHSHYDPHTLITKNGELLQTLRITSTSDGHDYESGEGQASVREAIRQAVQASVDSDKVALWLHTLRKRRPIRHRAKSKENFASEAHDRWNEKHRWRYQYYNEIYLTLLHDGQPATLFDQKHMTHILLPRRNRAYRNAYLDATCRELDNIVQAVAGHIGAHYKVERLGIIEREGIAYSQPMEFLNNILSLRSEPVPLPEMDVSTALVPPSLTFGFNGIETKNAAGKRRFGALLTLKQYREVPPATSDRFLQAPMEFIMTQTFSFIPRKRALKQYEAQKHYFTISGDDGSLHASGIDDMLGSDRGEITDFGEQQTSIMVLADDYKALDLEAGKVQSVFAELGLVTIREDLKLEECFWSQLPGNFEFIRRPDPINTARIGGFCRLNRFPTGLDAESHWGNAVAMLPTTVGSPYFFNFHHGDNGHTLLFDFNSFRDAAGSVLLNFLLTEARQYGGKLHIFDRDRSSRLLFDKLGGHYHELATQGGLAMNPFSLEDSPRHRAFLTAWCGSLAVPSGLSEEQKQVLATAIDQLYAAPPQDRHLNALIARVTAIDPILASAFQPWHGSGKFAGLFDKASESLDLTQLLHAYDMTPIVKHQECIIPVFSYLLHRIIDTLDGKPTILVLHEAWDLLENAFFAPRLESLLDMLRQHNVAVICTTSKPADQTATHCTPILMKTCATRLYVPAEIDMDYTAQNLDLNQGDAALLARMDRQKGNFLLKQNGESVSLCLDLGGLEYLHSIFAGDAKNLIAMNKKTNE